LHAWPHPYRTGDDRIHFPIGLGPAPVPRAQLATVAAAWSRGLPSVHVDHVECGAVPTLTR
ncbi:hypothetical protein, partial [Kitasatospora aureofaciens]